MNLTYVSNGHWRILMLLNIFRFENNLERLGWNHGYLTGPHVITVSVESRMISLKEHFSSYWRMYRLMFMRACGFNMTVILNPFHIMLPHFLETWISCKGPIWPSCSPDLNPTDIFICGCTKDNCEYVHNFLCTVKLIHGNCVTL
jgi:hypothetical protein